MKKILALFSVLSLLLSLTACGGQAGGGQGGGAGRQSQASQSAAPTEPPQSSGLPSSEPQSQPVSEADPESIPEEEPTVLKMEITVGEAAFPATLSDNPAARALLELLPMTLEMSELNGNEKYYYLDGSLPTNAGRPAGIHAGDIMLYGDSCLVLFYKSFSTSYSYTVLGRIDDPEGLSAAVGSGDVQVEFRKG